MITRFKIYEKVHVGIPKNLDYSVYPYSDNVPKVGDYVICEYSKYQILGIICEIDGRDFKVEFLDIPEELRNIFIAAKIYGPSNSSKIFHTFYPRQIQYWSQDREDLEAFLASKKYNI